MALTTVQLLASISLLWIIGWRLLRRLILPTPLENLPGPDGESWLSGHLNKYFSTSGWNWHREIAEKYGSVSRIKGVFGANELYVFDPKAVHHILLKDQAIFDETDSFIEGSKMMVGEGIFSSRGDRHRRHRKMLNPVFSINHMREMTLTFYNVAHKVEGTFIKIVKDGPKEIDIMSWMTRLALELIGQSGLGFSFDELNENSEPHRYGVASKKLLPKQASSVVLITWAVPFVVRLGPAKVRRWIVDHLPSAQIKEIRDIVDILHGTSVEIYESKKAALATGDEALAAQIGKGKDIISILMKANMQANDDDKLDDKELLGQVTSLTFAATDTTSGALSRTLHVLAQHKDVQSKVRKEIREAREANGGQDIDYDVLVALPYLDSICREILRLYPPLSSLDRVARQDTVLPLSTPVKGINGEYINEIPIAKGTNVHISILNSNTNPELWGPDAHEWKPERWLNPLPQSLIEARIPGIYSHLLTFIGGGRSCIGFKFSQLEMKVVLALMLEKFEFSLSDKSVYWQMTAIATPNLDAESTDPVLPLIVSIAR